MLFAAVFADAPPAEKVKAPKIDEAWFPLIGADDKAAFERLYLASERAVYSYVFAITKNADDTHDIVHDTFLKIREAAHLYKPQGKPLAWMFTIARNLTNSHYRRRSHLGETADQDLSNDISLSYVNDPTDKIVLQAALNILNEQERQIVLLHAVSGLKHHQIAADLGIPLSTALSQYHRALKKLRQQLGERMNG